MAEPDEALERYRRLAHALDARWAIPGTGVRFGYDAVIGLFPGIGDALAALIGSYGLYVGWRLGAPPVVLIRMLLNLGMETVVGTLPILGDAFDILFRADLRNVALLDRWRDRPGETRRRSRWLLAGIAAALLAIVAGTIGGILWLLVQLLRQS
jgi:Domain of unknown function (DUF4112)